MSEDIEVLDFTSGATNAEEFKKKEDAARKAARGSSAYFSLKNDGETAILRFLFEANQLGMDRSKPIGPDNPHDPTTGWIMTKQHSFVATKAAPKDKPADREWPESVGAICRRTPVGPDQHPAFPTCYVCDNIKNDRGKPHYPTVQMWASAVLREEVVGSQELVDAGRIDPSQIGQRVILDQGDWIDQVDDNGNTTGKKIWQRRYVIVNMAMTNFFSPLVTMADYNETILDRDYRVTRKGEPKARRVDYVPFGLNPYQVTVIRDGQPAVINYDLREPEIAALYADSKLTRADLLKIISRRVSTAYYNRFFDITVEVPWKDDDDDADQPAGAKPPSQQQAAAASQPAAPPPPATPQQQAGQVLTQAPTEGVTAESLAALRSKVMGGSGAPAPAAEPQQEQASAAPPAPAPQAAPQQPQEAAQASAPPPPPVAAPVPQQA